MVNAVTPRWDTFPRWSTSNQLHLNSVSTFRGELHSAQNNLESVFGKTMEMAFSNDEEKTDLGVYFHKFGWPKRKSNSAIRIVRKN